MLRALSTIGALAILASAPPARAFTRDSLVFQKCTSCHAAGADGKIVWENDPFTEWNVSVFGLILADELGNWPADSWNAVKTLSDRRIKAGGSARVRYDIPLSGTKGALKVEAQLLYRRAKPLTITAYGLDENVYGHGENHDSNTLEVLIGRVRKKLGADAIETRRGFGYLMPEAPA